MRSRVYNAATVMGRILSGRGFGAYPWPTAQRPSATHKVFLFRSVEQ